jgi:hypothetical protein
MRFCASLRSRSATLDFSCAALAFWSACCAFSFSEAALRFCSSRRSAACFASPCARSLR